VHQVVKKDYYFPSLIIVHPLVSEECIDSIMFVATIKKKWQAVLKFL